MSNIGPTKVAGAVTCALLFFTLLYFATSVPFPHTSFRSSELIPTQPGGDLGFLQSLFLWDYRGLDVLFAGLLLVTTAVSCLAMLREEKP